MVKWGQQSFHRLLPLWNLVYSVVWKQTNSLLLNSRNLSIEYTVLHHVQFKLPFEFIKCVFMVKVLSNALDEIK